MLAIVYRHRTIVISEIGFLLLRLGTKNSQCRLFSLSIGSDRSLGTKSDWPVTQFKGLVDGIVSQGQPARLVCMR
jgi:hypothetical protein